MASRTRKSSHKMKSSITDKREKSLLRVHRRSLDQREMRHEEVNKRRQIDDMSDMSPVIESQEASKNPSNVGTPVSKKTGHSRLEMLKKWKEERELKRKLEAMEKARSKPGFKVVHMAYKDTELYKKMTASKTTSVKEPPKFKEPAMPAATKPAPAAASKAFKPTNTTTRAAKTAPSSTKPAAATATKRTTAAPAQPAKKPPASVTRATRSRRAAVATKAVSPVPQKKAKLSPPKRAARSNFMAPTAASRTRAVAPVKKNPVPTAAVEKKTRSGKTRTAVAKSSGRVSTRRGEAQSPEKPSFAPSDFIFEAPSSVPSFVFKPLSPASAASFLFPQPNANNTTMSTFEDRVGRTSTPKGEDPPTTSSEEGSSGEGENSAGTKKSSPRRGRRSRSRQSQISAAASPSLADGKSLAFDKLGSGPVSDSAIEISAGMESSSSKIPTPGSSATGAPSAEESEAFTSDQSSSPVKNQKGKRNRKSTLKNADVAEEESQPAEEAKSLSCSQTKKSGKRKSKRVTIQEESLDLQEEVPAVKQRRKSHRSTIGSESISESVSTAVEEAIVEEAITTEQSGGKKTSRRKSRRSRRPSGRKSEPSLPEVAPEKESENQEEETTTVRKSRRSRCSVLPSAINSEEIKPVETESVEIKEVPENATKSDAHGPKRRSSRRSVAKQSEEESVEKNIPDEEKLVSTAKAVTLEDVDSKIEIQEPSTPENRRSLRDRRVKDDMFLTPGLPVSTQIHSTKKRRRTAAMIALSSAKSPEEAIKIIATSPMVEMTRRTPKSKISPADRQNQSTALLFDDKDFALEPMQLSSAFDAACSDATTTDMTTTDEGTTTDDGATTDDAKVTHDETAGSCGNESGSEKRDVTFFRQLLSSEIEKLTQLSNQWTAIREATTCLTEEVEGQIRTTVCQAQLLMDKKGKFHQFAGLVDKCEAGDPSTTCQDLQGFWDMIFMQAEDIYKKFNKLELLQQNNWQPEISGGEGSSQPVKKVKKPAAVGGKKDKPVVKSKFAAFKAQMMKQRKAQESGSGDVPVTEEKVFDAGFFKVNSPVISPQYHCEAGTPSKHKGMSEKKPLSNPPTTSKTSSSDDQTAPVTPKKAENKENVAKILLRRSMGATSGRRSFVQTISSPAPAPCSTPKSLLKPSSKARESTDENSPAGAPVPLDTPVRHRRSLLGRRTRSRKSSSVLERSLEMNDEMEPEEEDVDLLPYLCPSSHQSQSPLKESVMDNSPFSCEDVLRHSKSDTPASASPAVRPLSDVRCKSSLKALPSTERRRSRRSVSFAPSTNTTTGSMALPSTPYNRNSLLVQKRVTRHSISSSGEGDQSVLGELKELTSTPPPRRSAK